MEIVFSARRRWCFGLRTRTKNANERADKIAKAQHRSINGSTTPQMFAPPRSDPPISSKHDLSTSSGKYEKTGRRKRRRRRKVFRERASEKNVQKGYKGTLSRPENLQADPFFRRKNLKIYRRKVRGRGGPSYS